MMRKICQIKYVYRLIHRPYGSTSFYKIKDTHMQFVCRVYILSTSLCATDEFKYELMVMLDFS